MATDTKKDTKSKKTAQSVEDLIKRSDRMLSVRENWESYWQELAYYCMPRKAHITTTKNEGDRLPTDVYDSSAIQAVQMFAAGLHGYLTNPAAKWFNIRPQDGDLMDDQSTKTWFKTVEDKIYDVLNGSNFNQQIHEAYQDFSVFGTCALYEEEDEREIVRFYTRPVNEICIDESQHERVDVIYRKFKLTVRQAYQRWGDEAGKSVLDLYNSGKYEEKLEFLHCVEPRHNYNPAKKDSKNMPWRSVYINIKDRKKVSEGGYNELPYQIGRANKDSGEIYGTSPAMNCFSDIKMLNNMEKANLKAAMKIVDPPIEVPNDGYALPLDMNPSGVNIRLSDGVQTEKRGIEPIGTLGNVPLGFDYTDRKGNSIKKAFFVDLFLSLTEKDPRMTATEVLARQQERMLLLGPMLGRLMSEVLNPMISRVFNILMRKGLLPPAPPALQDGDYVIDYVSPLARAQKSSEISSIQNTLALVGQIAGAKPDIIDKIDLDKTVDEIADLYGINPALIRDKEAVKVLRAAREEAQAAAQQMAMIEQGAGAAAKAGQAAKGFADAEGASRGKQ